MTIFISSCELSYPLVELVSSILEQLLVVYLTSHLLLVPHSICHQPLMNHTLHKEVRRIRIDRTSETLITEMEDSLARVALEDDVALH